MAGKFKTLVDMIDNSLRSFSANRVFGTKVSGTYQWITYAQLGTQIEQFRGGLVSLGVRPGDRVAIIANNRVEWAVAAFSTYQLGASFASMYESQTADDWRYILEDSTPTVLIVSNPDLYRNVESIARSIPSIKGLVVLDSRVDGAISYQEMLERGKAGPVGVVQVDPGAMCSLIYTSGTTGKPKGVMLSHANIISNVNAILAIFPSEPSDVSLSFLPWAHSFGQTVELYGMLACGSSLGLAERVDTIIENLSEVRPTLLFSVPRIFNKIYDGLNKKMATEGGFKRMLFMAGMANASRLRELEAHGRPTGMAGIMNKVYDRLVFAKVRERLGGNLKYAFSGGAALSNEVARFIDNLNILVYEGYGLSETSPIMTANYPEHRKIGSVGTPIPGVTVKIDTSVPGSEHGMGEIINYGPNTMMGYYNKREETAAVMTPDGGFRTGDLGRMDEDGYLYITGRVKEQYKLENGKYVAPAPLEEKLLLSPYIAQAMIFGDNHLYNVAVLVPDFTALREWARPHGLSASSPEELCRNEKVRALFTAEIEKFTADWKHYEKPKAFLLLPEDWTVANDMLTPTLKLKRRNVVKKFQSEIDRLYQRA